MNHDLSPRSTDGETAGRYRIAVTADDVQDIQTVAQAAMDADKAPGFSPQVTATHTRGGVIVRAVGSHRLSPETLLRAALERMGYIVEPFVAASVAVIGRDPQHAWDDAGASQGEG